jgi:hypothetical protein
MNRALLLLSGLLLSAGCAPGTDTGTGGSTTGTHTQYTTGSGGAGGESGLCKGNQDGTITPPEFAPVFGVTVKYSVSDAGTTPPVDLAGAMEGGKLVWDFTASYPSHDLAAAATELAGKWYAAEYPGAQWTAPYDDVIDGIYSNDDQGIYLHGLCWRNPPGPGDPVTCYTYDARVAVYELPLTAGKSWVSVGQVSVHTPPYKLGGLDHVGTHTYTVTDDAVGDVKWPGGAVLPAVHRVRTKLFIHPSLGVDFTKRQTGFVRECFGEIFRATKLNDQGNNDDFNPADELRRLQF